MTEAEYMGVYFKECLQKGLDDMQAEFESGKSNLTQEEYNELRVSYLNMLEEGNVIYYYRAKLLTEAHHRAVTMRMNKALYQQYSKDKLCSMAALAIQLKKDDNKPNFLFEQA
jgi:hypothetical protein